MRITGDGVWGPPADREQALAVLRRAVELGVNLIDTADSYGPEVSEELIAEALHPYGEDLVIATKGGFTRPGPGKWVPRGRPEYLREACEGSLRRLRLERIDLYQLHVPDSDVPYEESVGALKDLQDEGKIRQIGVSNVSLEQLATARGDRRRRLGPEPLQPRRTLRRRGTRGLPGATGSPSSPGSRSTPARWPSPAAPRRRSPSATAPARPRSPSPGCSRPRRRLPIPGTSSVEHLEENLAAASIDLSDEEVADLTAAA